MSDDRHRDFDFWLGEWEVTTPDGTVAGHNRIERLFDGVGIAEHWEGVSGLLGASYNVYAAARGHWHQTWVDSSGLLLMLDGGLRDGVMVLEGTIPPRDEEGDVRHRISWSVIDGNPDLVSQHWETSTDAGASWETLFEGRYRRIS